MEHASRVGHRLLLDPAARTERVPQAGDEVGLLVLVVEFTEHRPDGGSGLIGVVEGNPGEEVVHDVSVNDAVEKVGANEAEVAVNGTEVAQGEVPGALGVVGNLGVRVVQVGDGNQPVVNPHVGNDPEKGHGLPVVLLGDKVKDVAHDAKAKVGDDDEVGLLGQEEHAPRVEVAAALREPALLVIVADAALVAGRDVEEKVRLPAEELVEEKLEGGDNGRVLGELLEGLERDALLGGNLLVGARDENEILLDVAGEAVVAGVRDLPREVRNTEERVGEPADDVVQAGVPGEGAVAALVGEDPQAGEDAALGASVEDPEGGAGGERLDMVDLQGTVDKGGDQGNVAGKVGKRDGELGLEAVGGNGALQVSQAGAVCRVPGGGLEADCLFGMCQRGRSLNKREAAGLAYLLRQLLRLEGDGLCDGHGGQVSESHFWERDLGVDSGRRPAQHFYKKKRRKRGAPSQGLGRVGTEQ